MTARLHGVPVLLTLTGMLSSTLLIPAVRPFFAAYYPGGEGAMHAFFAVNMLGAIVFAPLIGLAADRMGGGRPLLPWLFLGDGVLLLLVASGRVPLWSLLLARTAQGAFNVSALSILMARAAALDREHGAARSGALGLTGAATIAAIALGAPLGTVLLSTSAAAPLLAGAGLALLSGLGSFAFAKEPAKERPRERASLLDEVRGDGMLPVLALWLFAERFGVGCLVVTFALFGHASLGLTDADVGQLYSWLLLPFAIGTWLFAGPARRRDGTVMMLAGAASYGASMLLLPNAPRELLALLMTMFGLGSAAIYAPCLCLCTRDQSRGRATSMALINAAGSAGMMFGTTVAGLMSANLQHAGIDAADARRWVLRMGGCAVLVVAMFSHERLRARSRSVHALRAAPLLGSD